jgi:hypothetical protein
MKAASTERVASFSYVSLAKINTEVSWLHASDRGNLVSAKLTVARETFCNRSVRILSDIDMSAQTTRSSAAKTVRKIRIRKVRL